MARQVGNFPVSRPRAPETMFFDATTQIIEFKTFAYTFGHPE
jgi:hypothetical protein